MDIRSEHFYSMACERGKEEVRLWRTGFFDMATLLTTRPDRPMSGGRE
jgi:hypothetical protein